MGIWSIRQKTLHQVLQVKGSHYLTFTDVIHCLDCNLPSTETQLRADPSSTCPEPQLCFCPSHVSLTSISFTAMLFLKALPGFITWDYILARYYLYAVNKPAVLLQSQHTNRCTVIVDVALNLCWLSQRCRGFSNECPSMTWTRLYGWWQRGFTPQPWRRRTIRRSWPCSPCRRTVPSVCTRTDRGPCRGSWTSSSQRSPQRGNGPEAASRGPTLPTLTTLLTCLQEKELQAETFPVGMCGRPWAQCPQRFPRIPAGHYQRRPLCRGKTDQQEPEPFISSEPQLY